MLMRAERFLIFAVCAGMPVLFWPAAGQDEQFYVVKQAGLLIASALMAALRLAARAAGAPDRVRSSGAAAWAAPAVLAWFAASLLYSPHRHSSIESLSYFAALIVLYRICATHAHAVLARRAATAGTALGAVVACSYGVLDFLGLAGPPLFIDWGSRTASLFADPNMFGIYLLFPVMLCLGRAGGWRGGLAARMAWGALAVLFFAALAASYSRSAWVALGAALGFFAVASVLMSRGAMSARLKPAALALGFAACLCLGALAASRLPTVRAQGFELPARVSTISLFHKEEARPRTLLWRSALGMVRDKPLAGHGLGVFWREYVPRQLALRPERGFTERVEERSFHAYNDYLELVSETGIIGLALWVAFVASALHGASRGAARAGGAADLAPVAAAFGFFTAGALFQYPLFSPAPAALAMAWLGVTTDRAAPAPGSGRASAPARVACALLAAIIAASALWWAPRRVVAFQHFNKGLALERRGRADDAISQLAQAVRMQPDNAAFQFHLGRALADRAGDDAFAADRAVQALQASNRAFPYYYYTHRLLGGLHRNAGRVEQALRAMELEEKYTFGDHAAPRARRIEYLMQLGRAKQAVALQKELAAARPRDPQALIALARLHARAGDFDAALKAAEQSRPLFEKGSAEPDFEAADIFMAQGEYFDAIRRLEPIIGAAEKELAPFVEQNTGRLALDGVPAPRARRLEDTAARLARALFVTGRCYMQIQDPETALPYFHSAHRLAPSNPDFVYWGGFACEQLGNSACAASAYNAILQRFPDHAAARQALQRLR
jgi:O-antigen ligase/tetratricopeptide (TPR) repeat protein